jgi:hypothetical protein
MKLHILSLLLLFVPASAFSPPLLGTKRLMSSSTSLQLFNDLFKKAFENSPDLSADKRTGSIDSGLSDTTTTRSGRLTETQEKWRQQQQLTQLEGKYSLELYLAGIPSRDPSNDLFAARTTITTRDKDIGLNLPEKPTCENIVVDFLNSAKCAVDKPDEDGFCSTDEGDWIVKDDNFRFRLRVTGYTRTVQTTGTIQNVFWSNEEAKTTQTSTSYTVPEGWLYFEGKLNNNPKKLEGVLKVEQSMGLLGAGTKMVPCGKFAARQQQQ